jgi:Mlc titration factor MtfA (ptsG expression regulator)
MGIFRSIRRNRIVKEKLLPADTWTWLVEDHPILAGLSGAELSSLREMSTVFLHEKVFEGADGLELDQGMREVIAVQACLPILHLGIEWYENWKTIVVVPDVFVEEHTAFDAAGVVHEWDEDQSGESWDEGPVLLSWKDVEASGWGEGYNVIIHEAAHRLDMMDGEVNGCPALHKEMNPDEWRQVFTTAYKDLKRKAGRSKRGLKIDVYAIEDDGEFFAVTSEYFFERPVVLSREYPDVYRLMSAFYKQDPGRRIHAP